MNQHDDLATCQLERTRVLFYASCVQCVQEPAGPGLSLAESMYARFPHADSCKLRAANCGLVGSIDVLGGDGGPRGIINMNAQVKATISCLRQQPASFFARANTCALLLACRIVACLFACIVDAARAFFL